MWPELRDAFNVENIEKIKNIIKNNSERIDEEIVDGYTPLQYICKGYSKTISSYRRKYEIIKFLLEMGANVNKISNYFGYTPLIFISKFYFEHIECIKDNDEEYIIKIFEILLNFGADPNIKSCEGEARGGTALHYLLNGTSLYGFSESIIYHKSLIEIVKILIENGINVNLKDMVGRTAAESVFNVFLDDRLLNNNKNNRKIIKKIIKNMIENGLNVEEIEYKYLPFKVLFTNRLENENKRLKKEIEELKYRPGNPGYREAMEDFDKLVGAKKK